MDLKRDKVSLSHSAFDCKVLFWSRHVFGMFQFSESLDPMVIMNNWGDTGSVTKACFLIIRLLALLNLAPAAVVSLCLCTVCVWSSSE